MDWLRDTLGITMLDQDPEAWRKVNPKIAAKIDQLEARIDNLNNNAIKIAAVAERDSAKIDKLEERANTQLMMDMVSK
jgi:gamma-glutamyl:cysteine ligase YbdK (ATP-grasp superfamily)